MKNIKNRKYEIIIAIIYIILLLIYIYKTVYIYN